MKRAHEHRVWAHKHVVLELRDLHLKKLGTFRSGGGFRGFFTCGEDVCLWHYIEAGEGVFIVDRIEYAVSHGTLVVIFPGQTSSYHNHLEKPWNMTWGMLAGGAIREVLGEMNITPSKPVASMQDAQALTRDLHGLLQHLNAFRQDPYTPHIAGWEVMRLLRRHLADKSPTPFPVPMLDRALALVTNSFHPMPNVQELADQLGIGRVTLFRLFRAHLQTTPADYIDSIRYERACQMLAETRLSAKEITHISGFATAQHFNNWFHRKSGMTPRQYRLHHDEPPPKKIPESPSPQTSTG